MINEKAVYMEQIKEQRFLPITKDTFKLYQNYRALMNPHDPDELSYLLFHEGEYYFRIGSFHQALEHLIRCLQAPKSHTFKYLDVRSYNVIGLIYSYLEQESIAISYLLQGKALSDELHLEQESAVCSANLGLIYEQLEVYDTALSCYEQALAQASRAPVDSYHFDVLCHSYRGILYCKTGEYEKAARIMEFLASLRKKNDNAFYDISIFDLEIRLFDYFKEEEPLHRNLEHMISLNPSGMDFLELSDFYFDICSYLLQRRMQKECLLILDYIELCIKHSPLVLLRYEYLKYRVSYAKCFSTETDYLKACGELISLRPRYAAELNDAKLYSLEYVERLRQTKSDSEMYREKSRVDQMTGLLNKYTIQFLVEEDLSKSSSTKQSAMILVDLDHFKQINDTLGHLMGDSFICQTASIIQNYFKNDALCGRVGGDEFLIYINDISDNSLIVLQAEILRQEIYRRISERSITVTAQASIGIAFSSPERYDYESLFSAADDALYRAKMEGRNKVVVAD